MWKHTALAVAALVAVGSSSANAQGWHGGLGWRGGGWHGGGWHGGWGRSHGAGFGIGLISGLALGSLAAAPAYGYPRYGYAPAYDDAFYAALVYRPRVVVRRVVVVRPVYRPAVVRRTRVVTVYERPYRRPVW